MHNRHKYCCISILIFSLLQFAEADISLRVFTRDEALYENNISKPRFYIQNYGTVPLSNFYCYYYFSTDDSKTPQAEDYYTPDASISLENLGSGNYRVKVLFSGITINPGQTLPDPEGVVIGLHYTDWSAWDKNNDYSNTRTSSFALNGKIPVYSSSGDLIYGNDPGTPETPSQPPQINTETANYAILSTEFTDLRDGSEVKGGDAGSKGYIEAGCDVVVRGSLFSGGNMFLRERAHIYKDVAAINEIREQNGIIVDGSKRSNAQLQIPSINSVTVTPGTIDTNIPNNSICTLYPGNYRDVQVFSRTIITLMPGDYVFNQFRIEPHVTIILKVSNSQRINIRSAGEVRFADSTQMIFEGDTAFPYSINIETAQTGEMFIGNDCQIYGSITAPNAEVHVYSRTLYYGTIFGKKVVIERGSIVCKPPVLLDIWHSEWAYSPPFSSSIFDYTAVVPDVTSTLILKPFASSGSIVSVVGSYSDTIPLSGIQTDVVIKLNNPDHCGSTTYNVNVKQSANYQIFVNDDSPCTEANEDGLSWATAFKSLQAGIDKATQDGKEIWVAEGIYKPSKRIDDTNPRTATFLIQSGIEIKGGFKGTETNDDPQGSPYNTILTGDLAENDDSISSWPPAVIDTLYTTDNVYHVVTISENCISSSVKIERLTIKGGIADGNGKDKTGAGILNMSSKPSLEFIRITKNLADSSGAGFYDLGVTRSLKNCLFESNISKKGCGAGYYSQNGDIEINASVFEGNILQDTLSLNGGGAIYSTNSVVRIINSVFVANNSQSKSGAVYNKKGTYNIVNTTFAGNTSRINARCLSSDSALTSIVNSILWNDGGYQELMGDSISVTYSCVRGGHSGVGNINTNPLFTDISQPAGADGKYGDMKDGLLLQTSSPCRNAGTNDNAPDADILTIERPAESSVDMGAYEYIDMDKRNKIFFGKFRNGVFYENDDLDVIGRIVHPVELYHFSGSSYARVMRTYIENNKYTRKKDDIKIYVKPLNDDQSAAATEIEVKLYKTGEDNGLLIFQSLTPAYKGKKMLFTAEQGWHGCNNDWAYVMYMTANPEISCRVPHAQFK